MKYTKLKFEYGGKDSPATTVDNMLKIKSLFDHPKRKDGLVTFNDMQKVTRKKWVRGYFNALKKIKNNAIMPVRDGRELKGFRYATPTEAKTIKPRKRRTVLKGSQRVNVDKVARKVLARKTHKPRKAPAAPSGPTAANGNNESKAA